MTIKFHCEQCEDGQPVEIEPFVTDELNPDVAWGDIVCKVCHFVIASVSVDLDEQGQYEFVKKKNLIENISFQQSPCMNPSTAIFMPVMIEGPIRK